MSEKQNKRVKNANKQSSGNEDRFIYRALIDLAVLLVSFYVLHYLNDFYPTTDGFFVLQPILGWIAAVSGILFIAAIICSFVLPCRKKLFRALGIGLFIVSGIAASLYFFWYHPLSVIGILLFGGCILYLIHLLYPNDFTTISVLAFLAGIGFYLEKERGALSASVLCFLGLSAVCCIGILLLTITAKKSKGMLTVCGKPVRLYSARLGPLPLIISCIVFLIASVLAYALGAGIARYCLYGVGIYAFLAACYYTLNLN